MSIGSIIAVLLAIILIGIIYIGFRIHKAVKGIAEARIAAYTEQLNTLYDAMESIRKNERLPPLHGHQMDIVSSFPTMRLAGEAMDAIMIYSRKKKSGAPDSEIVAAKETAEISLVELNVSMREDLSLNTGSGRMPNSEVFRAKRKKE